MKQSSAAASSPLHHHSPQIRAMPSPPTSRYSVSSGLSPVTVIDETTSDVPLSGTLMSSSFTPKIEDTCTDSGIYTMDGMLNKRSPIMPERSPIISEQTSSLLPEESTSTILTEQSRSILHDQSTPIMSEQSRSMMQDLSASLISEQTRSMLRSQSASIINEPPRSLLRDQSIPLLPERSTMLPEPTQSLLLEQTSQLPLRIASVKSNAILNQNAQASTSSPNKVYPNSFDMSSKSFAPNGTWMFNQASDANDEKISSWLGEVFCGDNLTPGLSLPQKNGTYLKTE